MSSNNTVRDFEGAKVVLQSHLTVVTLTFVGREFGSWSTSHQS